MLLRDLGVPLKPLDPGTFLQVADQKWMVTIEWDGSYFKWQAQSVVSDLFFRSGNQTIELVHGNNAQKECARLLKVITSDIPMAGIVKYAELEENVLSGLKKRGYSKTSPKCELRFIEQSKKVCRYGVFFVEGSVREPIETYSIEAKGPMSDDVIIEEIYMRLAASAHNIVNTEIFLEEISTWVSENVPAIDEASEEPEEWTVVLSEDVETGEIHWTAEQEPRGLCLAGTIYLSSKELQTLGQEAGSEEVRRIFEVEVVPQLTIISNLDDVMKEQIPDAVRTFLSGRS